MFACDCTRNTQRDTKKERIKRCQLLKQRNQNPIIQYSDERCMLTLLKAIAIFYFQFPRQQAKLKIDTAGWCVDQASNDSPTLLWPLEFVSSWPTVHELEKQTGHFLLPSQIPQSVYLYVRMSHISRSVSLIYFTLGGCIAGDSVTCCVKSGAI